MLHDLAVYEVLSLRLFKLHVVIADIGFVLVSCVMLLPDDRLHRGRMIQKGHKLLVGITYCSDI